MYFQFFQVKILVMTIVNSQFKNWTILGMAIITIYLKIGHLLAMTFPYSLYITSHGISTISTTNAITS